ncbi:hypothetical protein CVT25_004657 [Psilocybe cyanescens]|uniref:Uncharacterized protein n=1 Tax=Psilocybe cyanescens TaxID=93625 RepID=A0A409XMN7_PSICY|nr:hypothetical protein CVT25_004657 [Psilocybe cyanescens]
MSTRLLFALKTSKLSRNCNPEFIIGRITLKRPFKRPYSDDHFTITRLDIDDYYQVEEDLCMISRLEMDQDNYVFLFEHDILFCESTPKTTAKTVSSYQSSSRWEYRDYPLTVCWKEQDDYNNSFVVIYKREDQTLSWERLLTSVWKHFQKESDERLNTEL